MADAREVYEFGAYLLDVGERRLSNAGQIVSLAPKAHDVLVALVRRAGTLVTKSELLDMVWGEVSVEEGILAGVDALSDAYKTDEPHAAITAFFAGRRSSLGA